MKLKNLKRNKKLKQQQKKVDANQAKSENKKDKTQVNSKKSETSSKEKLTKKADPDETILKEIKKFQTIVLKAYGSELMHIEGEDVQNIKLNELSNKLINEYSYQEFSAGITWHVVPNSDKSIGYLVATGKFYSKG